MNKIIEYQKLDGELFALDKQIETSKEHEVLGKMGSIYKEMQSKLIALEESAKKLHEEYAESFAAYQENLAKVKKLSESKVENLSEDKLNAQLDAANKISSDLFMLERKLNQVLLNMNQALKDFELTKNKGLMAKNKYGEAKLALENLKAEIEPKKEVIIKQLAKLETSLDKNLFAKYKALKHDNVFPPFVPLQVNRCGYCRMELPSSKINELKTVDFIICEQCRRVIYKPE